MKPVVVHIDIDCLGPEFEADAPKEVARILSKLANRILVDKIPTQEHLYARSGYKCGWVYSEPITGVTK